MKTTIDIPKKTLEDAMRFAGASTKREAVLEALEDFNRRKRLEELSSTFGSWDMLGNEEIEAGELEEASRQSR